MLQVARLAPRLLGESAALVASFLRGGLNPDGGFVDRGGRSDLYYSVFALEGLLALREDLPAASRAFVEGFGDGEGLDFVHLACLARCRADLGLTRDDGDGADGRALAHRLAERLERHRARDGGYNNAVGAEAGTAYGCFLAFGAYEDLGLSPPDADRLLACIERMRADDGGYANQPGLPQGLTPPTAAAAALFHHLGRPADPALSAWLLDRHHPQGGFYASPLAPVPDLLSTATALHALSALHADLDPVREPCLDFIDTLWSNSGGFCASWADDERDAEYTYYALLALGHLAV